MTIELVAVDEHMLLRMGLARLVASWTDISLVGEAGTAAEALHVVRLRRPDVVTIGVNLPDNDGISTALALRELVPDLGVVVLSTIGTDALVLRAQDCGLSAYVSKSAPTSAILAAIRHAAVAPHTFTAPGLAAVRRRQDSHAALLSNRERQVLVLMRDGRSLPSIAADLTVSTATVKTYVARLYTKLKVNNRAQALMVAVNNGLIPAAPSALPARQSPADRPAPGSVDAA